MGRISAAARFYTNKKVLFDFYLKLSLQPGGQGEPGADAAYCPCPSRTAHAEVYKPEPQYSPPAQSYQQQPQYAPPVQDYNSSPYARVKARRHRLLHRTQKHLI